MEMQKTQRHRTCLIEANPKANLVKLRKCNIVQYIYTAPPWMSNISWRWIHSKAREEWEMKVGVGGGGRPLTENRHSCGCLFKRKSQWRWGACWWKSLDMQSASHLLISTFLAWASYPSLEIQSFVCGSRGTEHVQTSVFLQTSSPVNITQQVLRSAEY